MSDPIKHVILLMLENHSFDQMLGDLKDRVYPEIDGVDRGRPRSIPNGNNELVAQTAMRETQMLHDPWHETRDVLHQLEDRNRGFLMNFVSRYPSATAQEQKAVVGYYPMGFLPALHRLAENFTVCEHWFSSVPGPTWPNRFFALTGTSMGSVRMPEGARDFAMLADQTQDTIFDRLTEAKRSWNIFYYDFPCSLILKSQREPAKRPHYKRIDEFFSLCENDESAFPDFAFIEPKFDGFDQNDDHPPHNTMKAQKLIADVYNAIRSNDRLWESSLLVVLYDEHGGFYDHVEPPAAVPPDEHVDTGPDQFDFRRLGVRVPALLISPWVKARVESTVFDHTSLLRYLIDKWGLRRLTNRSDQAASIAVALQSEMRNDAAPRAIRVPFGSLVSAHPEWELADLSRHHASIMALFEQVVTDLDPVDLEELGLAAFSPLYLSWTRLKAWLGSRLVAWGHRLLRGHRDRQKDVAEHVSEALWRTADRASRK